ncbi:hypothetical protein ACGC1H_003165 [Rhizoctonia solani]|uniref:Zn(2)-C6 fungal-type domain-containing protein n=1 Tax=Rhizoctonia solani TaxID=456999 RepID=A0A8H2X2H2_9AGAM|nr:unnamed protein product [Rhizoctonia solani]
MPASLRSTTGCRLCKTRRKKCDESKPECLRCVASGKSCNYEYVVENSGRGGNRVKRTKPGPRTTSEGPAVASRNISACLTGGSLASSSTPPISEQSNLLGSGGDDIYESNRVVSHRGATPLSLPSASLVHPWQLLSGPNPTSPSPIDTVSTTTSPTLQEPMILLDEDEDSDPEGIRPLICTILTVDKNVKDNTLPFVLHCYSRWAIARVFEPLKIAHAMREQIVAQFSSENTRTRTILIANVMDMFARNLVIDGARQFIVDQLVSDGRQSGSSFMATSPSASMLDRHNATRTLDSMLEVFSLQIFTQSLADCIQSLDYAAPIFRRACPEPPGQPVNLANLVLESNISLQYFANLDIIHSVTTGRPTYFQYEVPFSLQLCEQAYWLQEGYSLQWQLGFPVQFVLLFAFIGSLCETPGASNNPELIAWIETNLSQIQIAIDVSGDPLLRIGRMVVQECWRFAVLIYLYMTLCKADAHDPRVMRAQKGFMRLVRGVKPRRNPDAHLSPPMVVAGVVSIEERDRETLRQRILGVQEFTEQGTVGNDYMLELEEVWARTRNEGRPAVWSDLRMACFQVTGR